jgi:GNAT superfamily N-acetyltransferase
VDHRPVQGLSTGHDVDGAWSNVNGEYTASAETFRPCEVWPVRKLPADDELEWRARWQRFLERHAGESIVRLGAGGSGAGERDVLFMCAGLPVECHVTEADDEITGILTVNPITARCDEISMLFVDPAWRRRGLAQSLLSAATRDVLARGRVPAYSASGDRAEIAGMLAQVGYYRVARSWWWWR